MNKNIALLVSAALASTTAFSPAAVDAKHLACKPEADRISRNIRMMADQKKRQHPEGRVAVVYIGTYDKPHFNRSEIDCIVTEVVKLNDGYIGSVEEDQNGFAYTIQPRDYAQQKKK